MSILKKQTKWNIGLHSKVISNKEANKAKLQSFLNRFQNIILNNDEVFLENESTMVALLLKKWKITILWLMNTSKYIQSFIATIKVEILLHSTIHHWSSIEHGFSHCHFHCLFLLKMVCTNLSKDLFNRTHYPSHSTLYPDVLKIKTILPN